MDESNNRGSKDQEESKELDLAGLQNFNFASNWSESSKTAARPERESRHSGGERRPRPADRRAPDRRQGGPKDGSRREEGDRGERQPFGGGGRRRPELGARREEPTLQMLLRESPFDVQILPEEPIVVTLTQAMRHSMRTYELFEVSRLILEKPDRYEIGLRFGGDGTSGAKPRALYQSVPDGLPFLSEEAAVDHVMRTHLDRFFTVEEIEVDPPKGSFQFIARSTLTGEFLSPPNYHRYQPILLQYHQERFPDMPFERFRSQIETVKDEEAIQKWMEGMTKQTRYRIMGSAEGEEQTLGSPEEARAYLLRQVKDHVVRTVKSVKFSGKNIEELSSPDIRPYVVAYLEQQKRFPLDTANTMRGRLRRQHFFIYKKGARGASLVCAVKRKFMQPNQVFSDTVQGLISFLEKHDQIHASKLSEQFLGIAPPAEGDSAVTLDTDNQEKIKRLSLDLRWLLSEGYVTEYSDGRLTVHAVAESNSDGGPSQEAPGPGKKGSGSPPRKAKEGKGPAIEEKGGSGDGVAESEVAESEVASAIESEGASAIESEGASAIESEGAVGTQPEAGDSAGSLSEAALPGEQPEENAEPKVAAEVGSESAEEEEKPGQFSEQSQEAIVDVDSQAGSDAEALANEEVRAPGSSEDDHQKPNS